MYTASSWSFQSKCALPSFPHWQKTDTSFPKSAKMMMSFTSCTLTLFLAIIWNNVDDVPYSFARTITEVLFQKIQKATNISLNSKHLSGHWHKVQYQNHTLDTTTSEERSVHTCQIFLLPSAHFPNWCKHPKSWGPKPQPKNKPQIWWNSNNNNNNNKTKKPVWQ